LAFDSRAEASLEYLLGERVGIEAGVGYDWDNGTSARFDSSLMFINVDVERRELSAYLQGKYYFSPKVGADRFFAGLSLHYITIPTYKIDGEESGTLGDAVGFGLEGGYKWAIKERFIGEVGLLMRFTSQENRFSNNRIVSFDGILRAKIGYRF